MVKVVIIGGSYAGTAIAQRLDKEFSNNPLHSITLISSSECFNMNHANLRGIVDESFARKCFIPYNGLFTLSDTRTIISGKLVTEVRVGSLKLKDGTTVDFDYLAVASGSSYISPLKCHGSTQSFLEEWRVIRGALLKAKNVLIIGAGSTGCELAGEIATEFPESTVTLVSSGAGVLPGDSNTQSFRSKVTSQLESLKVKIVSNERIETDFTAYSLTPKSLSSNSGTKFEADVVFLTIGNADIYT